MKQLPRWLHSKGFRVFFGCLVAICLFWGGEKYIRTHPFPPTTDYVQEPIVLPKGIKQNLAGNGPGWLSNDEMFFETISDSRKPLEDQVCYVSYNLKTRRLAYYKSLWRTILSKRLEVVTSALAPQSRRLFWRGEKQCGTISLDGKAQTFPMPQKHAGKLYYPDDFGEGCLSGDGSKWYAPFWGRNSPGYQCRIAAFGISSKPYADPKIFNADFTPSGIRYPPHGRSGMVYPPYLLGEIAPNRILAIDPSFWYSGALPNAPHKVELLDVRLEREEAKVTRIPVQSPPHTRPSRIALSPDKRRLAWIFNVYNRQNEIESTELWVSRADGSDLQPVGTHPYEAALGHIQWLPDGSGVDFLYAGNTYLFRFP